jgi:integrase
MSRPLARKVMTSFKSMLKANAFAHVAADVSIGRNKRAEGKLGVGRDFPTTAEIKRLIDKAEGKKRALLLTVALTGLRASELRGLRWQDVDLKAGELHVRQRADRYSKIGVPKSDSSVRTVPLDPGALTAALREWKLACPKGDEGLVFPSSTGRIQHHSNMLKSLGPVMIEAGVVNKSGAPKYGLHAFRHFFASWCINPRNRGGRELPAKEVQQLLGHASIVLTMDVYGHLFPKTDDRTELAASARALLA